MARVAPPRQVSDDKSTPDGLTDIEAKYLPDCRWNVRRGCERGIEAHAGARCAADATCVPEERDGSRHRRNSAGCQDVVSKQWPLNALISAEHKCVCACFAFTSHSVCRGGELNRMPPSAGDTAFGHAPACMRQRAQRHGCLSGCGCSCRVRFEAVQRALAFFPSCCGTTKLRTSTVRRGQFCGLGFCGQRATGITSSIGCVGRVGCVEPQERWPAQLILMAARRSWTSRKQGKRVCR
jgi:hypothetical protein